MNPNHLSSSVRAVHLSDLLSVLLSVVRSRAEDQNKADISTSSSVAKALDQRRVESALRQFHELMSALRAAHDVPESDDASGESGCDGCGNIGSDGNCMAGQHQEGVDLTPYQGMSPQQVILAVRHEERSAANDYQYIVFHHDVPVYRTKMPYLWVDGWCSAKGLHWMFDDYISDSDEHAGLPALG